MRFNYLIGARKTIHLAIQWRSAHHFRYWFQSVFTPDVDRDSSVGIATRYGLEGPGIESRWVKIFRTRPDRPWDPPNHPTQWVPGLSQG
jgi:hypothetical protein